MYLSVRISPKDRALLEKMVEDGQFINVSSAVREGIRALVEKSNVQKAEV